MTTLATIDDELLYQKIFDLSKRQRAGNRECDAMLGRLEAAAATDWEVTPHDWRPDLYPHPEDGLPRAGRVTDEEER